MRQIDIENNNFSLRQLVELASSEPVVLMENGVPRVALVGVDEDTIESFALSNNPDFLAIIERSRESYRWCKFSCKIAVAASSKFFSISAKNLLTFSCKVLYYICSTRNVLERCNKKG